MTDSELEEKVEPYPDPEEFTNSLKFIPKNEQKAAIEEFNKRRMAQNLKEIAELDKDVSGKFCFYF